MKKITKPGIYLIKEFEVFSAKAYKDSVGIWTIGYGTTRYPGGANVKAGDTITEQRAEQYLKQHIEDTLEDI